MGVMEAQEAEQGAVARAGVALPPPSAALAASPEHPVAEPRECSGTAQSHQRVQKGTGNCGTA